jgi:hypothetical protein
MVNRYTPTVLDGTAHMEIMGQGEWVKWEDYASHIEAANQRAKLAQLDAEDWARLAACADDAAETARAEGKAAGLREAIDACLERADQIDTIGVMGECCAASCRNCADDIGQLALIPASPAEPAQTVRIDLVQAMFDQLCEAAAQSTWIPHEYYYANDWISDCCEFLKTGNGAIAGSKP